MNKLLLTLLLFPLLSTAQKTVPRFDNDTLYTTSGFKIYKGQTLRFGKGSYKNRYYRFINIKSGAMDRQLATSTLLVKEVKNFGISVFTMVISISPAPLFLKMAQKVTWTYM